MILCYLLSRRLASRTERNVRRKVYIKEKADSDRIKQELRTLVATQELNSGGVSVNKM